MSMFTGCAQVLYSIAKKEESKEMTEEYEYDEPETEEEYALAVFSIYVL